MSSIRDVTSASQASDTNASVRSTPFPVGNTPPAISREVKSGRETPTLPPHPTCGTEEQQVCAAARKIVLFVA